MEERTGIVGEFDHQGCLVTNRIVDISLLWRYEQKACVVFNVVLNLVCEHNTAENLRNTTSRNRRAISSFFFDDFLNSTRRIVFGNRLDLRMRLEKELTLSKSYRMRHHLTNIFQLHARRTDQGVFNPANGLADNVK